MLGSMASEVLAAADHYATCGVESDESGLARILALTSKDNLEIKRSVDSMMQKLCLIDSED